MKAEEKAIQYDLPVDVEDALLLAARELNCTREAALVSILREWLECRGYFRNGIEPDGGGDPLGI